MPLDGTTYRNDPVLDRLIQGRATVAAGWCQGAVRDGHYSAFCASGALAITGYRGDGRPTIRYDRTHNKAREALRDVIARRYGSSDMVEVFNDRPATTKDDILGLFDEAIEHRMTMALEAA